MVSLLLVAFLLQLAVHVVNTVGANTINELVSTHDISYTGINADNDTLVMAGL